MFRPKFELLSREFVPRGEVWLMDVDAFNRLIVHRIVDLPMNRVTWLDESPVSLATQESGLV